MVGFIINEFVDSVIGRSPGEVLDIHRELVAKAKIHGGGGLASSAIGGVDGALWDLHARSLDVPLRELFGSTAKTIPAYASAGFYESGGDESDFERDIQALVDAGYGAVKIKCGRVPLREDADRIRRAREILGPDIQLMVDANGAYRSVPEAMQMARTLAELDVSWFEEPLEIENERGYRELCRLSPVPVAAGENACTLEKIVRLIDAGVHVIQPDVGWTSGITTALAMAKVAEARGRTFCAPRIRMQPEPADGRSSVCRVTRRGDSRGRVHRESSDERAHIQGLDEKPGRVRRFLAADRGRLGILTQ